jgi:heptosyltransferase-1
LKILILKPSSLGDVIHALPVLRLLKRHWPESRIHWWLDINLVPLLEHDPDLSGIYAFERQRWAAPRHWLEILSSIRSMRKERFDLVIDLQGLARSSMFGWLANAETTVGLDNLREGGREGASAMYDLTPPRAPVRAHAVDRYLAVLPLLGVPVHWNFEWLPPRPAAARRVRETWAPEAEQARWVVLLPGGRWDNKRWPVQNFIELAKRFKDIPDTKLVVLGSKSERPLGEEIAAAAPGRCLNLAGATTLDEMIEWIRLGCLTITNDTGPMHVAAALHRPVLAMFGPTAPWNTGPYGQLLHVFQAIDLPCVPCLKSECAYREPLACLHAVKPEMVFAKARQILAEGEI